MMNNAQILSLLHQLVDQLEPIMDKLEPTTVPMLRVTLNEQGDTGRQLILVCGVEFETPNSITATPTRLDEITNGLNLGRILP